MQDKYGTQSIRNQEMAHSSDLDQRPTKACPSVPRHLAHRVHHHIAPLCLLGAVQHVRPAGTKGAEVNDTARDAVSLKGLRAYCLDPSIVVAMS